MTADGRALGLGGTAARADGRYCLVRRTAHRTPTRDRTGAAAVRAVRFPAGLGLLRARRRGPN